MVTKNAMAAEVTTALVAHPTKHSHGATVCSPMLAVSFAANSMKTSVTGVAMPPTIELVKSRLIGEMEGVPISGGNG